jgi:hypothetical protein
MSIEGVGYVNYLSRYGVIVDGESIETRGKLAEFARLNLIAKSSVSIFKCSESSQDINTTVPFGTSEKSKLRAHSVTKLSQIDSLIAEIDVVIVQDIHLLQQDIGLASTIESWLNSGKRVIISGCVIGGNSSVMGEIMCRAEDVTKEVQNSHHGLDTQ